jgi:hypothetical protein
LAPWTHPRRAACLEMRDDRLLTGPSRGPQSSEADCALRPAVRFGYTPSNHRFPGGRRSQGLARRGRMSKGAMRSASFAFLNRAHKLVARRALPARRTRNRLVASQTTRALARDVAPRTNAGWRRPPQPAAGVTESFTPPPRLRKQAVVKVGTSRRKCPGRARLRRA